MTVFLIGTIVYKLLWSLTKGLLRGCLRPTICCPSFLTHHLTINPMQLQQLQPASGLLVPKKLSALLWQQHVNVSSTSLMQMLTVQSGI